MRGTTLQYDNIPSCGDVQDGTAYRPGRRGGPQIACVRCYGPQGDRCVHNAVYRFWKHKCTYHHDRREGFGHDQRRMDAALAF